MDKNEGNSISLIKLILYYKLESLSKNHCSWLGTILTVFYNINGISIEYIEKLLQTIFWKFYHPAKHL